MTREEDLARGVMTKGVITVAPHQTVGDALRLMIDHDIGAVVVASDDAPVGVFTERDLTRRMLEEGDLLHRDVNEIMSSPVLTAEPDTEVDRIFELMSANGIRRLPIVEDGKLVGIVTERDLLRWVDGVAHDRT